MHEEDDGWETIQDAQNAAALFVLFSVSLDTPLAGNLYPLLTVYIFDYVLDRTCPEDCVQHGPP